MMDLERRNGYVNNKFMYNDEVGSLEERDFGNRATIMESSKVFPISSSSSSSSATSSSPSSPHRYIEHRVTKFDTLAGVAIKYGVEVADIKKMNGLVSDLQMFARKTLLIPLPGRHPPSLSNNENARQSNSERIPPRRVRSAFFDSFQSLNTNSEHKVSPAMSYLRGYYGLNSSEMASHQDNEACTRPLSRRCKSMANFSEIEEGEFANNMGKSADKWVDKHIVRCPKQEVLDIPRGHQKVLKQENGVTGGWFSTISGKSLALRKAPSRNNLSSEGEGGGGVNKVLTLLADSLVVVSSSSGVRKSSSTPSLQEQETNLSSIWPDIQAALARPIFDGFTKPIASLRVKTALD